MTIEYLAERKEKYQKKQQYFSAIGFDNLANNFQGMVDLICEMEEYIKENTDIGQNDLGGTEDVGHVDEEQSEDDR